MPLAFPATPKPPWTRQKALKFLAWSFAIMAVLGVMAAIGAAKPTPDRGCSGWAPGLAPSDVGWTHAVTQCAYEAP